LNSPRSAPAQARKPPDKGFANFARNTGAVVAPVFIILVLWEALAHFGNMPASLFPPLEAIFRALMRMAADGNLAADVLGTFRRLFESVFVGAAAGTVFGTLMGYFKWVERAFVIPMNFLLAIPGTALFPLSMIWFGLTETAIVSILIYEVALTVTVTTWTGVKTIDVALIRAARVFGANGLSIVWRVLIPGALPSIISGYRIAFSRAWRILIIAEMLVSVTSGLGYRLYFAREFFQYDLVYAGLLIVGISGLLIERVVIRPLELITVNRWGTVRVLQ
jgi:taurine transport system permease protein